MVDTEQTYDRHILLNWLISKSVSHAKGHAPPTHGAEELLGILQARLRAGTAVEFFGATEDDDDAKRIAAGRGYDLIRLKDLKLETIGTGRYAFVLIEHIDQTATSFPVVNIETFSGREIEGDEDERGAATAHVVIRLPTADGYDDAQYRCAVEAVRPITRRDIESLLCRQLRRYSKDHGFVFPGDIPAKAKGKGKPVEYKYRPRLELAADVGRALDLSVGQKRTLSQLVFVNRSEKKELAGPTSVLHEEYLASVEVRVSAKQAPTDEKERAGWLTQLRTYWEGRGYETRAYYRNANGSVVSGEILHRDIEGAADLVMCPKEMVTLPGERKGWRATFCDQTLAKMREIVDRDELWSRAG